VVPAPAFVLDTLAGLTPRGTEGRKFTKADGSPITAHDVSDAMADAVAAASLPVGTTFHDLRHFDLL
jgi:hypothetical protein